MKMNVYFLSTLLFLPVLIQGTSPLDKSPPRIPPPPNCVDKVLNCQDFLAFCENNDLSRFMKENCQKSCGLCEKDASLDSWSSVSGQNISMCMDILDCSIYDDMEKLCTLYPEEFYKTCALSCGVCECSDTEDGFESGGKCYKIIRKKPYVSWYDAKDMCTAIGLRLVEKPADPIGLRKYIVDTYAHSSIENVWLYAKGDGSGHQYLWQHDNSSLSFKDPLFYSSEPSPPETLGTNGCLCLIGTTYHMNWEPNRPYAGCICESRAAYTLCEGVSPYEYPKVIKQ